MNGWTGAVARPLGMAFNSREASSLTVGLLHLVAIIRTSPFRISDDSITKLMRLTSSRAHFATTITLLLTSAVLAQNTRVEVSKHVSAIPKSCVALAPAAIEGTIDIPALVKEAICKGSGDMLVDYTYTVEAVKRQKDKKGKAKEERITYEVFIPTLKSGARTRGVLVVTSRNNVPVPAAELEKERMKAAERIEKEESKIEKETPAPAQPDSAAVAGLKPLGMYTRTGVNRESFGVRRGGVTLAVTTFLKTSDLTFLRREVIDGRETLIFILAPRLDSQFTENERYIAQLRGEIWIDAQDRIVTRLAAWPREVPETEAPAVFVEMMRLPQHKIWLPHIIRINGADYPTLFDGITTDSLSTYSNYIRFTTDVKDATVGTPSN